ncbi:MAG: hypothetical protein H8F28_21485, partial [Fibrella sp.]|nr:hypothetical protein [Armatimonadota bacterium]
RLAAQMGFGGMVLMNYVPTVVFKDGSFYEDYDVPLADFDVSAARRARPNAWGKWRRQGGAMQAQDSKGVWETVEWLGPLPGGKPGEKLSGRFSSFTGGGNTALGGGTAYGVSSDIFFAPDGRFTTDQSVGFSSAEPTSDVRTTVSSRSGKQGTYTISDYILTMKFNDGRVQRRAFMFMDSKDKKDGMYLDGTPYTKKD